MQAEVAVVGGGLAGASFAAQLAAAGRDVLVIEREAGPHDKVCGEFLSREAQLYLNALGIDPRVLGAVPVTTLTLAAGNRTVTRKLPFQALGLSRRVLDEAVLAQAVRSGARLLRGHRVVATTTVAGGTCLRLENGAEVTASRVVLATGKHDLRGHVRPAGQQNDLIGFKMLFRLTPTQRTAFERSIALMLFAGGYAGLQPVEDGRANLCLLVRRNRFAALGRDWTGLLAAITAETPSLAEKLVGARPEWAKPLTIARLPYGLVMRQAAPDGFWRLGDQAAVIPSFSGDGMSIALHSARRAAAAYLRGETSAAFQAQFATDIGAQVRRATWLSRLGLYRPAQRALVGAARFMPGLLTLGVTMTRVPERHLTVQPG